MPAILEDLWRFAGGKAVKWWLFSDQEFGGKGITMTWDLGMSRLDVEDLGTIAPPQSNNPQTQSPHKGGEEQNLKDTVQDFVVLRFEYFTRYY
ncbi:hypothetical protein DHEL01_v206937 [Diaporthe helianthi]|uniref:Uncharacterized protein n=1 Tax=Diaporthe helianthi TaxID=158607 RepID=A0A2P5HWN4_DIAHE|nr:hypothetical protein DHEL01_v206937 [Diaporthe helianthi]